MRRLDRTTVDMFVRKLPRGVAEELIKGEDKIVLAGGYCRSLLTGNKVRDLDIFISNKGKHQKRSLELRCVEILNSIKEVNTKALKFISLNTIKKIAKKVSSKKAPAKTGYAVEPTDKEIKRTSPVSHTLLAKDNRPEIQVCRGFDFDTPLELLESFDFTVCQIGLYYEGPHYGWDAICTEEFWKDINTMRLVYNPNCKGVRVTSIKRVHKYLNYGFTMDNENLKAYLNDYNSEEGKKGGLGKDRGSFS